MLQAYDVRNGTTGKYWDRDTVKNFVDAFDPYRKNMDIPKTMFVGSIIDAVGFVRTIETYWNKNNNFKATSFTKNGKIWPVINTLGNYPIEGVVARPKYELYCSNGDRVITKIKCKDYSPIE